MGATGLAFRDNRRDNTKPNEHRERLRGQNRFRAIPPLSGPAENIGEHELRLRPWSLIAATPMTTSTPSRASRVFSTADKPRSAARSTTPRSSAYGLEGLVRDNRVEVRVL